MGAVISGVPPVSSAWTKIGATRLTAAGNITITGIPPGYKILKVILAHIDTAGGDITMILNGDVGNNYNYNETVITSGVPGGAAYVNSPNVILDDSGAGSLIGVIEITIQNNTDGDVHPFSAVGGRDIGNVLCSGYWNRVTEINQIDLAVNASTFAIGTYYQLFGAK